jgi:hypothetical protein
MDQKTNTSCLINGAEFAFMTFGADITEYSVAFDKDLSNIRD